MPVIPEGVPKFSIRPPCTINDKGEPSKSVEKDAHRVFALIEDERHITAFKLLKDVQKRIEEWDEKQRIKKAKEEEEDEGRPQKHWKKKTAIQDKSPEEIEMEAAKKYLHPRKKVIEKLENRHRIFIRAQKNLNEDADWTYASTHFGITTYYRREADKSLSIKLEGEMKGVSLFEQVCVLKEVDLHYKWAPFCTSSMTIADLDKLDLVGWCFIGLPRFGLARDACFRAIGCDNMSEDGTFVLAGQGIQDRVKPDAPPPEDTYLEDDPIMEKLDIPAVPNRRGTNRVTIRKFEAVVRVLTPTSATARIVANVDPNIYFLPNTLLEFLMKHLAGVLIGRMQSAARKAMKNPIHNDHARIMREEKEFYQDWLLPKFKSICEEKGWEMPPVAAFSLTKEQMQVEKQTISKTSERRLKSAGTDDSSGSDIVENISAVTSPPVLDQTDTVSDLSEIEGGPGSVWSNNPIAAYIREQEEKVRRRKALEIAAGRRRNAEMLKPKELSFDKKERLEQLKKAKARRLGIPLSMSLSMSTETIMSDVSAAPETLTLSQKFSRRLRDHNRRTRIALVSSLVTLLFVLLHADWWIKISSISFAPEPSWPVIILEDAFVVFYIFLCAVPHFILCDVAMVYAFDSLELGSKSGLTLRKFYSDNVRYVVAVVSVGIVGFSVLKGFVQVGIRLFLWSLHQAFDFGIRTGYNSLLLMGDKCADMLPEPVFNSLAWFCSILMLLPNIYCSVMNVPARFVQKFVLESNFLGRKIASCLLSIFNFLFFSAIEFECKATLRSWRHGSFETARSLFSYTSVFLLTVLVLFTASAQKSSFRLTGKKRDADGKQFFRNVSSISVGSNESLDQLGVTSSKSDKQPPIPENGAVEEKEELKTFKPESLEIKESRPDTSPSGGQKRLRYRGNRSEVSNLSAP